MVRHDNRDIKAVLLFMPERTAIENNASGPWWQDYSLFCHKRNEMRRIILLNMRQITPVEAHCSIVRVPLKILTRKVNVSFESGKGFAALGAGLEGRPYTIRLRRTV